MPFRISGFQHVSESLGRGMAKGCAIHLADRLYSFRLINLVKKRQNGSGAAQRKEGGNRRRTEFFRAIKGRGGQLLRPALFHRWQGALLRLEYPRKGLPYSDDFSA